MRWNKGRTDHNQAAIVDAFRHQGAEVWVIGQPCDLLVLYRGVLGLVEVKNAQGRNRNTDSQDRLKDMQQRQGLNFHIVRTGESVCSILDQWSRASAPAARARTRK